MDGLKNTSKAPKIKPPTKSGLKITNPYQYKAGKRLSKNEINNILNKLDL